MRSPAALRAVALALAVVLAAARGGPAAAQPSLETEVKATYVYKIAPFFVWPYAPPAGQPFAICIVGADPFGAVMDRAIAGQSVDGRPIVLRRLPAATHDAPCQIAFVAGSRAQSVAEGLRALRGAPVVTVTQSASSPGMVDLRIVNGRVRFAIDLRAATQSRLTVSSKLLDLATGVTGKAESDR